VGRGRSGRARDRDPLAWVRRSGRFWQAFPGRGRRIASVRIRPWQRHDGDRYQDTDRGKSALALRQKYHNHRTA